MKGDGGSFSPSRRSIRLNEGLSLIFGYKSLNNLMLKIIYQLTIPENGLAEIIEHPEDVDIDHEAHL
jgi:hypothetical protein